MTSLYERAEGKLGNRSSRKVAHATYLIREGTDICVRYHDTDVVTMHDNGTFTLDTGGWYTLTTRKRMEEWSPCSFTGPMRRNMGDFSQPGMMGYCREPHEGGPWMCHPLRVMNTGYYGLRPNDTIEFEDGMIVDRYGRSLDHLSEVK